MDKAKTAALLSMLHESGRSWKEIADTLGMSPDQLRTMRYKMGLDGRQYGQLTKEKLGDIKRMRGAGKSWAYIEAQTGYTAHWMQEVLRNEAQE